MSDMSVRPAVWDDAEAIRIIQLEGWLSAYPNRELGLTAEAIRCHLEGEHGEKIEPKLGRIRSRIESDGGRTRYFVARLSEKVIGFSSPCIEASGRRRVGSLYVLPAMHGRGAGSRLLEANLRWHGRAHDVYLHVVSYNEHAISFYEHHGFSMTGVTAHDDIANIDGIILPEREMIHHALQ
jgi:GNAT superfamily N-acetyltransferase